MAVPTVGCLARVPCPCPLLSPAFSPSNPVPSVPLWAVLGARRQLAGGSSPLCCTHRHPGLDRSGLAQQQGGHSSRRGKDNLSGLWAFDPHRCCLPSSPWFCSRGAWVQHACPQSPATRGFSPALGIVMWLWGGKKPSGLNSFRIAQGCECFP